MRRNAFGQLIPRSPRIITLLPPDDGGSSAGGGASTAGADPVAPGADAGDGNGFPANTPLEQMTEAQQLAYWKHQSRKHEAAAKSRADYDELKRERDELKAAGQTQAEKDLEAAREEARLQGENIGAEKYLGVAIRARFQHLTGKSDDDVAKAFERVDPKSFLDAQGEIDQSALKDFADLFGTNGSGTAQQRDPVREALENQRLNSGTPSTGSIAEMTKQKYEQLTGKK